MSKIVNGVRISEMYNPRTGGVVDAHPAQVAWLLQNGYELFPDEDYTVALLDQNTQRWDTGATVRGRDYIESIRSSGGQVQPYDINRTFDMNEANSAADREEQMGGPIGQAVTGVASAAQTLGDLAVAGSTLMANPGEGLRRLISGEDLPSLTGLGEEVAPTFMGNLEALQTENPGSDLIGSVVGATVPSLLAGGAIAPAVAASGMSAAEALSLTGPAATILRGGITAISEGILGGSEAVAFDTAMRMRADPNYAAESLVSSFGTGAAWGGGVSAAFQVLGGVGGAALRGVRRIRGVQHGAENGAQALLGQAERDIMDLSRTDMTDVVDVAAAQVRRSRGMAPGETTRTARIAQALGGTPTEVQLALEHPRFIELATDTAAAEASKREVMESLQTLLSDSSTWRRQGFGVEGLESLQRSKAYRTAYEGSTLADGTSPTISLYTRGSQMLDDLLHRVDLDMVGSLRPTGSEIRTGVTRLRQLRNKLDEVFGSLEEESIGGREAFDRMYGAIASTQQELFDISRKVGQREPGAIVLSRAAMDLDSSLLTNPDVVGPGMAHFRQGMHGFDELVRDPLDTIVRTLGRDNPKTGLPEIDSEKVSRFLYHFRDSIRGESPYTETISALHKLSRGGRLATNDFLRPMYDPDLVRTSQTVERLRGMTPTDILEEARRDPTHVVSKIQTASQYERARTVLKTAQGSENQQSAIANLIGGGLMGGVLGYSMGSGLGLDPTTRGILTTAGLIGMLRITRPGQFLQIKTSIKNMAVAQHIRDIAARKTVALQGLSRAFTTGSISPARIGTSAMVSTWMERYDDPQERLDSFDEVSDYIRTLATDTELRQNILTTRIDSVSEDPRLAMSVADSMNRALDYLTYHLPQQGVAYLPGQNTRPSMAEIDSFMQRMQALDDPYVLLDQIAAGMVNPDAVDAVRNVYPSTFSDILESTMEVVTSIDRPLSYQHRLQMSFIVGPHMDPTLDPSFVMSMQSHGAQTTQQSQVVGSNFNGAQIDYARQNYTSTQRLEDN